MDGQRDFFSQDFKDHNFEGLTFCFNMPSFYTSHEAQAQSLLQRKNHIRLILQLKITKNVSALVVNTHSLKFSLGLLIFSQPTGFLDT